MFSPDFYPTPANVIDLMMQGQEVQNKAILEPSAGKGNIVEWLINAGAGTVIACENQPDLRKILATKCNVIESDFLNLTREKVSHIDMIVMNPPFSADDRHINHAWDIAPAGCQIIALCNYQTFKNQYSKGRQILGQTILEYGQCINIGDCFGDAERKTDTNIGLIKLQKPGTSYGQEFAGFFMEDDPQEQQYDGIMPYNVIRDLVNRYVESVKLFDTQMDVGVKMNKLIGSFYKSELSFTCTDDGRPKLRNDFKKELQKSGWDYIFEMLNMQKYATRGLKEDINKFVEQQQNVPFTMRNIYKMLEIVIGTQGARMDKALLEVFDKLTKHYDENRYQVEGWKTNSHYLVNRKFIMPWICTQDVYSKGSSKIDIRYNGNIDIIEDLVKALCHLTGSRYEEQGCLREHVRCPHRLRYQGKVEYFTDDIHYSGAFHRKAELENQGIQVEYDRTHIRYGELFEWSFFKIRAFKKGTMHFEFKDEKLWQMFNQRIAKLKGYALYEPVKPTRKTYEQEEEQLVELSLFS